MMACAALAMDGQCQDEFRNCTDGQHTASCPLRTGVVCCLPTCAQGSSAAVTGGVLVGTFLGFLGAPWSLVYVKSADITCVSPHIYRTRVTEVCLSLDTPIGRRLAGALSA